MIRRGADRPAGGRELPPWPLVGAGALLVALPLLMPPYPLVVLSYGLVLAIACLAVNLLLGTTGLLSLGHAAYFGVGAYAGGFLFAFGDLEGLEAYLLAGVLVSTVLATAFGAICVRATKIHFTILTLALAQVVHALFIAGVVFRMAGGDGRGLFLLGGGGMYIPRFTILATEVAPERFIPVLYYVILGSLFGSAFVLWRIGRSPFGLALRAIRDNETRAAFIGIPVRRYRWYAFVISGLFAGLAGGLFGQLDRQVTPEYLHWLFSAKLVLATVLGGTGPFLGPVVGALVFVALQELSRPFALQHGFVLGVLLIVVVLVLPGGVAGGLSLCVKKLRGGQPWNEARNG